MDARKCHWCGIDIGNGNFETREGRIQYFCCLLHIQRWAAIKADSSEMLLNLKIFVCGKYIGKLIEFELE